MHFCMSFSSKPAYILQVVSNEMTTSYDSFLDSSSPYYFWKERVGTIVKPSEKRKNNSALQTQTVSSTLLELCTSSLFGDGQWMHCTSGLDLLATNFVMVSVLSLRTMSLTR
ncbi:hypothetical protein BJ741DRAFT_623189 [Chytriomyces cf. hyalinus JEL632]|nr:hypothetical protein BJ741DRAFT_623189 [Chytriomyces cf. hyalinus JEL632]